VYNIDGANVLEMFARDPTRRGWDSWGNEVEGLQDFLQPYVEYTNSLPADKCFTKASASTPQLGR